jgi:hypothetical protein
MTVKELIEELQKCPEDYRVWYDYCGEMEEIKKCEVDDFSKEINLKPF